MNSRYNIHFTSPLYPWWIEDSLFPSKFLTDNVLKWYLISVFLRTRSRLWGNMMITSTNQFWEMPELLQKNCIFTSQGQRSGFRGEADATADDEAVRSENLCGKELFWFLSTVQHMARAIINQLAILKRSWDLSQVLRSTYLQTVVFLGEKDL